MIYFDTNVFLKLGNEHNKISTYQAELSHNSYGNFQRYINNKLIYNFKNNLATSI